tara:strand:- start:825 stop:2285 length:1461 start_codon:yes stop_codon:yes gene_type:complete
MLINGKISYQETEQLVYLLKEKVINSYLKKIYHYQGLWLFKFNHFQFVFEPGVSIWIGDFAERETNLHSISIKLRKEIGDHKVLGIDIVDNDRTVVIQFKNHKLILELYAKGNILLLNEENKIIVLTRIYPNCSHGKEYQVKELKNYEDYQIKKYGWKIKNKEINDQFDDFENILEGLKTMWEIKKSQKETQKEIKKGKKSKNKSTPVDNIQNQIKNFNKKIDKKLEEIEKVELTDYENIDYKKLGELHQKRKEIGKKLSKASTVLDQKIKSNDKKTTNNVVKEKLKLVTNQWYQKYHWWYTKNNFLVVGGKNSTDNEKLVKSYINDNDLYFHSEDPGSGSFIMFTENRVPEFSDIDETAEGVLALSNQWNSSYSSGTIFYVKGNQVSKTPPSGEYISKGSFMIYGKKEFVKVTGCTLGYGIYENKLMLAPYRIVSRINSNCIKLKQRSDIKKMKGKLITSALKKTFNIDITDDLYIFNKPCQIIC